jgi:hypothetical protein
LRVRRPRARRSPVRTVPFKGPSAAIAGDAAVQIVGKGPSHAAGLAGDLVHVVWRRCGRRGGNGFRGAVARRVVAVGVLLDQRVGAVVLHRRGGELIGIIIAKVEPLHGRDPGVVLCPGLDLAFGVVGVILLRDEVLVRIGVVVQVFDLLQPLVTGVREVEVIG